MANLLSSLESKLSAYVPPKLSISHSSDILPSDDESLHSSGSDISIDSSSPTCRATVFISQADLSPDRLKTVYDEHAFDGLLRIVVGQGPKHAESVESVANDCLFTYQLILANDGDDLVGTVSLLWTFHFYPLTLIQENSRACNDLLSMLSAARLRAVFVGNSNNGACYIIERPLFVFPPLSAIKCLQATGSLPQALLTGNVPSLEEWELLWKAWDSVTLQMISQELLHQQPIDLRHRPLFYIGHLPT